MALIKCPECGENVSDKADVCIHCGYPLSEYVAQLNDGLPRYDLYVRNINASDEDLEIEKRLLIELLGISRSDFIHIKYKSMPMVAQNLTIEQVSKVMGPFVANGISFIIFASEHNGEDISLYSTLDGYLPEYEVKLDHYEQVISEAQKVEMEQPEHTHYSSSSNTTGTGIRCPNCGSAKVQRITMPGRVASTAVFGIASKKMTKTYKCNGCGHTW